MSADILIVDDNAINLKLVRVLLAAVGYRVHSATSSAEALELLEQLRPGLILMDIQLPDIDGLELTRRIKARPELARTPVIAITAYAMKGDDLRAIHAGCDGYVTKPIDTRALPGIIARHLAQEEES